MKYLALALLLAGCSTGRIVAPSTAETAASVNSAKGHVNDANKANAGATKANTNAHRNLHAIDSKLDVIDKYWK